MIEAITNDTLICIVSELSGFYRSPPEAGASLGDLRMTLPAGLLEELW